MARSWAILTFLGAISTVGCASDGPCLNPIVASAPTPHRPCRTDGCTLAPDFDFGMCCDLHDHAYWQGGSRADRLAADRAFRECIADRDRPVLAAIYFGGVRVGGVSWLPTPWRWGFGWDYPDTGVTVSPNTDSKDQESQRRSR